MDDTKTVRAAAPTRLNGSANGLAVVNIDSGGNHRSAPEESWPQSVAHDALPLETRQVRPARRSLIDTMTAAGRFTTFLAAIETAGLTERVSGQAAYTVFAPTDAAFAKLDAGALAGLLKDKAKLTGVLDYHFVAGRIQVRHVKPGKLTTLQGSTITVSTSPRHVRVNNAFLTLVDLLATNGVVHAIDAVILPANLVLLAARAPP